MLYDCRAFAVVVPTVWNALVNDLRDSDLSIASFGHLLKMPLFQQYLVHRVH